MHLSETLFIVALFFYSLVIWWHKFTGRLSPFMVWLFGVGLSADVAGTFFVCVLVAEKWKFNTHTVSGLAALLIMALHFLWAISVIRMGKSYEAYFNRFSIWAWFVWLVAFFSGIPR